jgi:CobW/HypB/UreG family nucleotide-binding protein
LSTHLILVGGFLGAGKTTLLLAAGARLRAMGRRVGVILNDQGGELVDTRLAEAAGFATEEITGGCFCCRFSALVEAAERMTAREAPEVILAEPVGSCTDLSATILQPIKRFYGERFRLAPFTVLVDPGRVTELLRPDADPLVSYLFRKQIAEADIVRFSKSDRYGRLPSLEGIDARPLSAHTGEGIGEWLDEVLSDGRAAGARLLEIDYARYAEAEAALGWLNWQIDLRLVTPLTPAAIVGPLVTRLDALLTGAGISIAHLKAFTRSANGHLKVSICRNGEAPSIDGPLDAPPAKRHALTLNLRAAGAPEVLTAAVERAVSELPGSARIMHQQSFRPSPPVPEHRFQQIV